MNKLDPNLKRMIAWAKRAPVPEDAAPPAWLAAAVAAAGRRTEADAIPDRTLSLVTWTGGVVAAASVAFVASRTATALYTDYFETAAQVVLNFTP